MNNPGKIVGAILLYQLTETTLPADLEAKLAAAPAAMEVCDLLQRPGVLQGRLDFYQHGEDATFNAWEKVLPQKKGIYVYLLALVSAAAAVFFLFNDIIPGSPHSARSIVTIGAPGERTVHQVLPDGTEVWLNARSTLSYPRTFDGLKQREVTLIGEGYFDITPGKSQPFIIRSAHQRVEVLGTQVDISAYPDERFSAVSLLSGSVRVIVNEMNRSQVLIPGEEAWIDGQNPMVIRVLQMTNVRQALEWRAASFDFDHTDLYTIMRQLARWYDIDVVYDKGLTADTFTAHFSKTLPVDQVLRILELTKQVRFTRKGRKIVVGRP